MTRKQKAARHAAALKAAATRRANRGVTRLSPSAAVAILRTRWSDLSAHLRQFVKSAVRDGASAKLSRDEADELRQSLDEAVLGNGWLRTPVRVAARRKMEEMDRRAGVGRKAKPSTTRRGFEFSRQPKRLNTSTEIVEPDAFKIWFGKATDPRCAALRYWPKGREWFELLDKKIPF